MAELDYAYLADFVAVQDGKLTAVGASFTHVRTPSLPTHRQIGVGGRIKMGTSEGPARLELTVDPPAGEFHIQVGGVIASGPELRPYGKDGQNVGLLFAFNLGIPLPVAGLYVVRIAINGDDVRRLAFDVEVA